MPSTTSTQSELQDQFLSIVARGQEITLDAIRTFVDTVQGVAPRIPSVDIPFADQLPKPQEIVASGYDFAEQLLASQRKFASEVIKATSQLLPGDSK
jgi:hypothetical protein